MRELIEKTLALAQAKGAEFADLRITNGEGTSIQVQDGQADKIAAGSTHGAGLRVLVDGAWGFAPTNNVTPAELAQCVDDAVAMAKAASTALVEPGVVAPAEPVDGRVEAQYRIDPRGISLQDRVEAIFELEQRGRNQDPKRIVNTVASYADGAGQMYLGNTLGSYVEYESVRCSVRLMVTAQQDDVRQWASEHKANSCGYELMADIDPDEFAGQTAQQALDLLDAQPPPAGKFEVIIDPQICGLLVHEAFGHNCEADAVWAGNSILEGKLDKPVAAELVTIIDDPTLPDANGSFEYDHEGVAAQRHVLVKDGILQGYLHNLETAARFGVQPNGAARAMGHMYSPLVRMSNTFIQPGEASLEEMIGDINHGLYLKGGYWGYVFTARGQFTCNVQQAYDIHNGQLGQLYRNVSISGMTLETLQRVTAVGNDLQFRAGGTCGKGGQGVPVDTGGPHVRIHEVVVGGQQDLAGQ